MNTIAIHSSAGQHTINRHIYGHFAEHLGRCIYDGIWVGEKSPVPDTRGIRDDIVAALRHINAPNLRWPGGCFADVYHWEEGIGPRDQRPVTVNMWGDVTENNAFGTHEFLDLCDQIGCEPYFGINVGSGTVHEMMRWTEYLTYPGDSTLTRLRKANGREDTWRIPFWGIGNENWGCGGHMTPEYYGDLYCQYQEYVRQYGDEPMMKIASGYGGNDTDGSGLDALLAHITQRRHPVRPDGVSLHYYVYLPHKAEHSATEFDEARWFEILLGAHRIGDAIQSHSEVLDRYDPEKKIWLIVDEWGAWYPVEPGTNPRFLYQQNTMRDAVVAALTLHHFQGHCERVQMANIAQTVNVIQALFLTQGEQMILTPTYHVFDMFKGHQGATMLPVDVDCESYTMGDDSLPAVSASASRNAAGDMLFTLCNLHPSQSATLSCDIKGAVPASLTGTILAGDRIQAHNTFDEPDKVKPEAFHGASLNDNGDLTVELPAASVVALTLSSAS